MFDIGPGIGYFEEKVLHLPLSIIMTIGVFAVQSMLCEKNMIKETVTVFVAFVVSLLICDNICTASGHYTIPECSVDRIDYSSPQNYLDIDLNLGNKPAVLKITSQFKGSEQEKLIAISQWISQNITYGSNMASGWRSFDDLIKEGKYGGCATHSILFGALARGCGIPTVWVKTMDIDWIRAFQTNGGICSTWKGHVFLEIFIDGRWMLLDATQTIIYRNYKTGERVLPGNRYAYDKGGNPYSLILSARWELWKKQTRDYFIRFDTSTLPVNCQLGYHLMDANGVFIAADGPMYMWMKQRCKELGYRVRGSFNSNFQNFYSRWKGNHLIVTCVGDRIVLPKELHKPILPVAQPELKQIMENSVNGVRMHTLEDGTMVYLVFGINKAAIRKAISSFTFELDDKKAK